jgi:hypothetical protein
MSTSLRPCGFRNALIRITSDTADTRRVSSETLICFARQCNAAKALHQIKCLHALSSFQRTRPAFSTSAHYLPEHLTVLLLALWRHPAWEPATGTTLWRSPQSVGRADWFWANLPRLLAAAFAVKPNVSTNLVRLGKLRKGAAADVRPRLQRTVNLRTATRPVGSLRFTDPTDH